MTKITLVLLLICLMMFVGCEDVRGNTEEIEPILETDKSESDKSEQNEREIHNEVIEDNSEIAEMITYDYFFSKDGYGEYRGCSTINISGLKIFKEFSTEEFGYKNEGSVTINSKDNILGFYMTTFTGPSLASGSLPGPDVVFTMSLETNEILNKRFRSAPNYAEQAERAPEYINPNSIKYSKIIIELSDERLIEIGLYFKEYIIEIEKGKKEHSTDI